MQETTDYPGLLTSPQGSNGLRGFPGARLEDRGGKTLDLSPSGASPVRHIGCAWTLSLGPEILPFFLAIVPVLARRVDLKTGAVCLLAAAILVRAKRGAEALLFLHVPLYFLLLHMFFHYEARYLLGTLPGSLPLIPRIREKKSLHGFRNHLEGGRP